MANNPVETVPSTSEVDTPVPALRNTRRPNQRLVLPEIPTPVAEEVVPVPTTAIGETILYHEMRGPVPAVVQHIYPDGSLRVWVYGQQSIYPKDGVVHGKEMGYWETR